MYLCQFRTTGREDEEGEDGNGDTKDGDVPSARGEDDADGEVDDVVMPAAAAGKIDAMVCAVCADTGIPVVFVSSKVSSSSSWKRSFRRMARWGMIGP